MSTFNYSYPAIDLGLDAKDNDTYLSQLSSFLAGNSASFGGSLSSPELTSSSNGSSPESTAGGGAQATQAGAQSKPTATGADKRKQNDNNVTSAHKDRRDSVEVAHTHDGVGGSDEDESGEGKGKTSERRRQQNRQAQRAFRERKEKHLKELEDRVFSLEQQSEEKNNENSALKQLLERLQNENERLKVFETAFSFTYADAKNMPPSSQFKPPTPPTAADEVDDLTNFNSSFSFGGPSPADTASSSGPSLFGSFGNSPTSFGMANPSPPAVAGQTPGALDSASFLKSFTAPSPASTTGDSAASGSSVANVATPPDDLFSSYRDPSASFGVPSMTSLNDFDTLFGSGGGSLSLDAGADDFSAFLTTSPQPSAASGSLASVAGVSPGAVPQCPLGMDKAAFLAKKNSKEPFTFDLDNLCSDLKAKAVCQEAARQALQEAMKEDANSLESLFPTGK